MARAVRGVGIKRKNDFGLAKLSRGITQKRMDGVKIIFRDGKFLVFSSFSEKDIAKAAGCRWNPEERIWWTDKAPIALKLREYVDDSALAEISKAESNIESSKLTDAVIDIPCPEGQAYLPFQRAGIAFCMKVLGIDSSLDPNYIKGIGKEAINADRNLSEKCRVQKENDGMTSEGPGTGGQGDCKAKVIEECERPGMASEGRNNNQNQNGGSGSQKAPSIGSPPINRTTGDKLSGREWAGTDRNPGNMEQEIIAYGLPSGACDKNERTQNKSQAPTELQGGLCKSERDDGDRAGRPIAPQLEKQRTGQEKNGGSGISRMEGNTNQAQLTKGGQNPSLGALIADEMG